MSKLKAKGRAILRAKETYQFPAFNIMDYNLSMMKQLNVYSIDVEEKNKQAWAIEYWQKKGLLVKGLDKLNSGLFNQVGALVHMIERNIPVSDDHVKYIDKKYAELLAQVVKPKEEKVVAQKEKPVLNVSDILGELEGQIDVAMTEVPTPDYFTADVLPAVKAKMVSEVYKQKRVDWFLAANSEDEYIKESYSHLGKRGFKRVLNYIDSVIATCDNMSVTRKVSTPRTRKAPPASKIVTKLKYLKEHIDYKFKSILPEKIVGANEVWLFDTEKRRLVKYIADDNLTLTVKGTTILNWNVAKSGSKIVRKPNEVLANVSGMTKRPMGKLFDELVSVFAKVSGRTNENQIIIAAF